METEMKMQMASRSRLPGGLADTPAWVSDMAKNPDLINQMATSFLDAHIFAGGASMPSVIGSAVAVRFKGQQRKTDGDFGSVDFGDDLVDGAMPDLDLAPTDLDSGSRDAPKLLWETLRTYPSVLGVPFYNTAGKRTVPIVGWAGHDPVVVGQDANAFMFNRPSRAKKVGGGPMAASDSLDWYEKISMGWSDYAAPGYGTPAFDETKVGPNHPKSWDSRYCPAKRFSFAMAQAFIEALELEGGVEEWRVRGGREKLTKSPFQWPSAGWDGFVLEKH
jgi:hypothetical protein